MKTYIDKSPYQYTTRTTMMIGENMTLAMMYLILN